MREVLINGKREIERPALVHAFVWSDLQRKVHNVVWIWELRLHGVGQGELGEILYLLERDYVSDGELCTFLDPQLGRLSLSSSWARWRLQRLLEPVAVSVDWLAGDVCVGSSLLGCLVYDESLVHTIDHIFNILAGLNGQLFSESAI